MKNEALVVAFLVVVVGPGCLGPGDDLAADDRAVDAADDATKADGVIRPVGTYRNEMASAGELLAVVLKADRTFRRETMVYCVAAPCYPVVEEGTYSFSKSGSTRYIRFKDDAGALIDRYAYALTGEVLGLRLAGTSSWQQLRLSWDRPYCAAVADCELQELPQPRCPGRWTCAAEVCVYECGNACEMAGGECVALYPGACDGVVGDAARYGCGNRFGIQCCLPAGEACGDVVCPAGEECCNASCGICTPPGGFCTQQACEPVSACEAQGGTCVPVVPDACAGGVLAGGEDYSCGGMVGVTCCMPAALCVPVCQGAGAEQGWYDPCTGAPYCPAKCAGSTASCGAVGSRSEGWYASNTGCLDGSLIAWADCAQ